MPAPFAWPAGGEAKVEKVEGVETFFAGNEKLLDVTLVNEVVGGSDGIVFCEVLVRDNDSRTSSVSTSFAASVVRVVVVENGAMGEELFERGFITSHKLGFLEEADIVTVHDASDKAGFLSLLREEAA